MGIIDRIINKIKVLLLDLKRSFGLIAIISIMWLMFLVGIVFLYVYIGDQFQPRDSFVTFMEQLGFSSSFIYGFFTQVIQGFIAGMYILIWLLLWHRLVRMYFWRTVKNSVLPTKKNDVAEE